MKVLFKPEKVERDVIVIQQFCYYNCSFYSNKVLRDLSYYVQFIVHRQVDPAGISFCLSEIIHVYVLLIVSSLCFFCLKTSILLLLSVHLFVYV